MKRTERNPWYQRNFCSRAQAHPYVSLRVVHKHCYFYSSFFLWKKKFVSYLRNCDKALSMGQQIYLSLSFLLVWEIIRTFMNDFQCVVAKPKFSAVSNQIPNYQVSLSLSLFSSASVLSWISMGTGLGPWLSDFRAVHLFFFLISCLFPPYAYYKIFVTSSLQLKARFVVWLLANGEFVWKVLYNVNCFVRHHKNNNKTKKNQQQKTHTTKTKPFFSFHLDLFPISEGTPNAPTNVGTQGKPARERKECMCRCQSCEFLLIRPLEHVWWGQNYVCMIRSSFKPQSLRRNF